MASKTAFVLSGGGASAAWQVGAVKAFLRAEIFPDVITANSAGSLNAVGLSYAGIDELESMWLSIQERKDVFSQPWPTGLSILFNRISLMSSKPLRQKIEKLMKGRSAKWPICVNSVSLKTGRLKNTWDHEPDFPDQVIASASIPIVVEPVKGEWVDGGIRENSPVRAAIEAGADKIFLFLNSPKERLPLIRDGNKIDSIREIGARVLSIMMDEALTGDIASKEILDSEKKIELIFVQPDKEYLGTMDFDHLKIQNAITKGFNEAQRLIEGLKK